MLALQDASVDCSDTVRLTGVADVRVVHPAPGLRLVTSTVPPEFLNRTSRYA
jgi:hypothetical protein